LSRSGSRDFSGWRNKLDDLEFGYQNVEAHMITIESLLEKEVNGVAARALSRRGVLKCV